MAELVGLDTWVASEVDRGSSPLAIVGACARRLADNAGLSADDGPALLAHGGGIEVTPGVELTPWTLGSVYERALDWQHRHREGVHFTPEAVAVKLAEVGLRHQPGAARVCDPSVGGGAFLLAAAEVLARRGLAAQHIVEELLWGIDLDPGAVEVAAAAVALWAARRGVGWVSAEHHLVVADTLVEGAAAFGRQRFDVVIGNPPFQGQLGASTARDPAVGRALRDRWDVQTGPYVDTSAFFLLAGLELADRHGSVLLVQPQSVLGTGDAEAIRAQLTPVLAGLWVAGADIFDAKVAVCAPMLQKERSPGPIERWTDVGVDQVGATSLPPGSNWSAMVSDLLGVPSIHVGAGPVIGDIARATAGFRQQFYGLAEHAVEGGASTTLLPLVTVGMIDPLRNRWGTSEFRFAGKRWTSPCIDHASLAAADPSLAAWVDQRRSPKLLVATQTRVIEVIVDTSGDLVPSTPTIAVTASPELLWKLAAALTSPVLAAVAFQRVAGAALAPRALKLSAAQLLELPLPMNDGAWTRGAQLAREASEATVATDWNVALDALALEMCDAYGLEAEAAALCSWWAESRPRWR